MGALVAAFSKNKKNVVPKVVTMLAALQHRGSDMHGIATADCLEMTRTIQQLRSLDVEANAAIGHNLSRILPKDVPQPVQDKYAKFILEGRFFPLTAVNETQQVIEIDEKSPEMKAGKVTRLLDGSYALALLTTRRIILGRDPVGLTPLYYGEDDETFAFASERKALWCLGIQNTRSFPPGNLAITSKDGVIIKPVRTIIKPEAEPISMENAAKRLQSLLMESLSERVRDSKKVAMAFSGGLDSSVVASIAKRCELKVELLYVGMEGRPEIHDAETSAEFLDLPLHAKMFTSEDVEEVLLRVLWLIEEPDALKVSVAIPFYWIAEVANRIGLSVLLAGQGSDELFGGYYKYLSEYASQGARGLEDAVYRDVVSSYMMNFERDNKVCAFHTVELRLPFADFDMIRFSLGLPVHLKIASTRDQLRKRVLREVAKRIGLPPAVYNMRKGAIQYTTGIDRVLRKLAKEEGLGLKDFINESFRKGREIYGLAEPPKPSSD